MGAFILLVLYLALLMTALGIGLSSSDLFGSLIAAGIMAMWLFQIVENIGMDLGLMPITGIPLAVHELRLVVHVHELHMRRAALVGLVAAQRCDS